MKLNILKLSLLARPRTHEGAPAIVLSPEAALRRSVLACMLWEDEFYESGQTIAARIRELVPRVEPATVAELAVEARTAMKLRHAPLFLVREMARYSTHRGLVAETLVRVIQRADELTEFVAIYWADGRVPLSAQVKKGLAAAFTNFGEYALAKYDRAGAVRLRDVLFLSHARPRDAAQAELWKRLVNEELATPNTWEIASSSGGDKRLHWERLLVEGRLGALALLRNLRNMHKAGVSEEYVAAALETMRIDRVLPFRFLAAARHAPQWEPTLERAMFRSLEGEKAVMEPGSPDTPSCSSTSPEAWSCRSPAAPPCCAPTPRTVSRSCSARSQRRSASTPSPMQPCESRPGVDSLCATRWSRASATEELAWELRSTRCRNGMTASSSSPMSSRTTASPRRAVPAT